MRLATVTYRGGDFAAVLDGRDAHLFDDGTTVGDLVRGGLSAALAAGQRVLDGPAIPLSELRLRAPIAPVTIRDFVTFEEHVEGVRGAMQGGGPVPDAWYEAPHFYFTNPHTVAGPDDVITPPWGCELLDFELEVAVVVGRDGRNLSVDEASTHIFGYTILDDWSARDLQRREMEVGLGPAKGKDFANSLGPVIVTADEFDGLLDADGFLDLGCQVEVNGEQIGTDRLANMGWTFPALIAYASRDSQVRAGDVLGSGTTGNGGCLAELWGRRGEQLPPPLQPGDTVTLTVEGIGALTNTVGTPVGPPPPIPGARRRDPAAARAASPEVVSR